MRPTPLGGLLWGAGWLLVGAAVLAGTVAAAVAGVALLGLLEAARLRTATTSPRVERDAPERARLDATFQVTVTAHGPEGTVMRVEDPVPAGLQATRRHGPTTRSRAREVLHLRSDAVGGHRWRYTTVHLQDPWGTHEQSRRVAAPGVVQVLPEQAFASTGRRVGRRNTVKAVVPGRFGMETVPEVESVRPYQPGDRLRDIDWRQSSRMDGLYSKERERVISRPVIVLLDAGPSMRWKRRSAKLTTSARLAVAVLSAAQAAGVATHLFILGEGRVGGATTRMTGRAATQALRDLERIAPVLPVDELPWPRQDAPVRQADGGAFRAATGAARADPMQATLRMLQRLPEALTVAILDAEAHPDASERALRRLGSGRRTVLVAPGTGSHQYRRAEATGARLGDLRTAYRRRHRVAAALAAHRIPTLSLHPDNIEEVLGEVMRWAR